MNDNKIQLLFNILLSLEKGEKTPLITKETAEFSIKAHLTPLLYYLLKKSTVWNETEDLLKRGLTREFNIFISNYISHVEPELNFIYDIFEKNSIEFLPIKGIYNQTLYPEPFLRPLGDYDIFIKKNDMDNISQLLYNEGYKIHNSPNDNFMGYISHAKTFMHKKFLNIDLHYRIFQKWRYPVDERKIWENSKKIGFRRELAPEDAFIINAGNIIKDRFAGPLVRLWDLYYLLNKNLDYNYIDYQIEKAGLNNGYLTLIEIIDNLFNIKIKTKIKGYPLKMKLAFEKNEGEAERYLNALQTIGHKKNKIIYTGVYALLKLGGKIF